MRGKRARVCALGNRRLSVCRERDRIRVFAHVLAHNRLEIGVGFEAQGSSPDDVRRACITEDGVPLRLVEGTGADAETLYEATEVSYGAQDPAQFRVPAGYQSLSAGAPAPRR